MAGLGIPVKLLHEAAGITWAHDPEKQGKVINDTIMIYIWIQECSLTLVGNLDENDD